MSTVHFMLGEKGGIGKSQTCVFLAQGLEKTGRKVGLIDLDPATQTLVKYKSLEVMEIKNMISDISGEIDSARFDELIEIVNDRTDLDDIIIDTGSSNCIPFNNYLNRNDSFDLFTNQGHDVIIHTVIAGGDLTAPTLRTFEKLHKDFPGFKKILWLNEYAHKLDIKGKGVEALTDTEVFKAAKGQILAVFRLPYLLPQTEAPLINRMSESGLLFAEVSKSNEFKLAEKHRLEKFSSVVIGQISEGMSDILNTANAEAIA